jgi:hypothetical protein
METLRPEPQHVIVTSPKSIGLALVLTFFFGPLGMLYSTTTGGIVMFIVTIVVGIFTVGIGLFVTWPICMIWAAVAASNSNKKLGL